MIKRTWDWISGKAGREERAFIVEELDRLQARVTAIEAVLEADKDEPGEPAGRRGTEWDVL